ncbi:MAG: sigma-54-dependent Fis family transcriptional regulator [Acidobacteria bacterium]|nr:sigma-54-dependent Fis family transcriptional regulator [Acidobacteriota bacterium]MBI3472619.1 sigma-54-dependent Fis family transcriptional regulator [Candidatus Solibacter usitatus]
MHPAGATVSHGFVGQSPQIAQIRALIPKLGRSRSAVLLLGESGVGKEVIARAIHDSNPTGNFVPIDCGSLVGPLMESELFGHTKGAFTGAAEAKRGLIDLANGGTAFFDEIGDLPLEMQVKLLRVLQEREYRPVGSLVRHKVELRVIAATHRDLAREVEQGRFRQDLYYRLNVIAVHIPPLREHKQDLPGLIEHFLAELGGRHSLAQEALAALIDWDWPGNVRELWNCLQRMTALNSGPLLHTGDLPSPVRNHMEARQGAGRVMAAAAGGNSHPAPLLALHHPPTIVPLAELERRAILEALEFTRGDRSLAAHLLGIGRTTLYRKLKEYRLEP